MHWIGCIKTVTFHLVNNIIYNKKKKNQATYDAETQISDSSVPVMRHQLWLSLSFCGDSLEGGVQSRVRTRTGSTALKILSSPVRAGSHLWVWGQVLKRPIGICHPPKGLGMALSGLAIHNCVTSRLNPANLCLSLSALVVPSMVPGGARFQCCYNTFPFFSSLFLAHLLILLLCPVFSLRVINKHTHRCSLQNPS